MEIDEKENIEDIFIDIFVIFYFEKFKWMKKIFYMNFIIGEF